MFCDEGGGRHTWRDSAAVVAQARTGYQTIEAPLPSARCRARGKTMDFVRLAAHDLHADPLGDPSAYVLDQIVDPIADVSGPEDKVSLKLPLGGPLFVVCDVPVDRQAHEPIPNQSGAPQERAMNKPDESGPAMGVPTSHAQTRPRCVRSPSCRSGSSSLGGMVPLMASRRRCPLCSF